MLQPVAYFAEDIISSMTPGTTGIFLHLFLVAVHHSELLYLHSLCFPDPPVLCPAPEMVEPLEHVGVTFVPSHIVFKAGALNYDLLI